jgi:hypothetical protein
LRASAKGKFRQTQQGNGAFQCYFHAAGNVWKYARFRAYWLLLKNFNHFVRMVQ